MPTFNAFSNILPDPTHPITDAGDLNASGTPGPGFSAIGFSSVTDTQSSRTVSGRGVNRDGGSQHWEFTISYNPMFRFQFDPVDTFLAGRNPRRDPFYVVLPQYAAPKDPLFKIFVTAHPLVVLGNNEPGTSVLTVAVADNTPLTSYLRPGDMFTISDVNDYNHQKVYKVSAVEKNSYWQAGTPQPSASQMRLHISPPLQRATNAGSSVVVIEPKFRVQAKSDIQEHSLNTENLYSFSLALEEIQP